MLGVIGWGGIARAVRSQTLSLRERGFLEAARGLGLPTRHIIVQELLPNIAPYVAMNLLLAVIGFVDAQVGLFFLGVVPFTSTNWGVMLNQAVFSGGALQSPEALIYLLAPLACILLLIMRRRAVPGRDRRALQPASEGALMTTPTKKAAPEAGEAEVRVRDLTVHYRIDGAEYPAVANASLDLRRG